VPPFRWRLSHDKPSEWLVSRHHAPLDRSISASRVKAVQVRCPTKTFRSSVGCPTDRHLIAHDRTSFVFSCVTTLPSAMTVFMSPQSLARPENLIHRMSLLPV
jgi:hypothetical protein